MEVAEAALLPQRFCVLLAVPIGCGLRRREAAGLTVGHIQLRDKRWVIVDLVGKARRVRSVPMPSWDEERHRFVDRSSPVSYFVPISALRTQLLQR